MFSPETLAVFRELLNQVNVQASDPNFDATVARVKLARDELAAAELAIPDEMGG